MKIILIKEHEILVDDEDFELVSQYNWRISSLGYVHGYKRGVMPRKDVLIHRLILDAPKGLEVDHTNRSKFDNQKANLRLATRMQNKGNTSLLVTNTSGFKGVCAHKGKWQASINTGGKVRYLGRFDTPQEAALEYDNKAVSVFGVFARLNFARKGYLTVWD